MNQGFSFGHWIKQQRLALDLTQDVLAERVGCSTQMIRKLEGGERRPSRTMAQRLALGLGLSEDAHSVFVEAAVGGYAPTPPRHSVPAAGNASLAQQTNLPVQRDRLIGRERELAEVAGLLRCDEVGIVTLVGPGGTGKTRLALQLAANLLDDFADGVWFVDLAPVRDPAVVASAIASTFNLTQTFGESLLDTLRVFFREKQLLLLLDNFEQVVNAAPLLADLLTSAAHVKLLVTSRVVLHLAAEQEYVVPPLALPDLPRRGEPLLQLERLEQYGAVELFIKRAKRVKPHFAMTTRSAPAIAEICTRLDGLPLAIELAAARCKLFTPEGLLQRLDRRMELLTGGARDKEKRHQTLRGTIDWSYNLLDMQEKQLFIQLAVFVGGFTLEAAEAVCHGQGDVVHNVLEGLTSLVDKSLLRQEAGWDGEPRFRMLETIREYAWERLVSHAEVEEVRRQHAAYFLVLAECAERQLRGREQRSWLTRLELEHDNLRAVLRWAFEQEDTETALRLGSALATFWEVRGYWNEGGAWLTSALQMLDAQSVGVDAPNGQAGGATARVDQPLRAKALLAAARVIRDMEAVMPMLMEALQLFRELGETQGMADTLRLLGSMLGLKHGHERATALLTESLSLFRQIEDAVGCANALTQLGHIKLEQRALGQARALSEEALALWRALGHPIGMAWSLNTLGEVARLEKDYSTAGEYYSESLALGRELGHRGFIANSLHNLAYVEQFHGHYAQAAAYFMESLALAQELDNQATIASCLAGLASVMIVTGQHDAAVRRAIQLLGAVEAVRERLGVSLQVADLEEWSRSISSVRAGLDEGTFAAAWAEGRALSLEQALAYAI